MSVQTQIDRIKANIASAYAKAQAKGAELPAVQNSENLPATIESISGLPVGLRTITVAADPTEGGDVFGGGMASDGMVVTVKAEPNEIENYRFDGWWENGATVSEETDYTFTVQENKALTAIFTEIPLPILPDGYTEVEYICPDSISQYIDTEINVLGTLKVSLDVDLTSAYSIGTASLAGIWTRSGSSSSYKFSRFSIEYQETESRLAVYVSSGANSQNTYESGYISVSSFGRMQIEIDQLKKVFKVNEQETSVNFPSEYQNTTSLFLFGNHRYITGSGAASNLIDGMKYNLYACKLWNGETLVRNYIPCTNPSGEAGLYDLVSDKFYGNSGTGVFIPGPAV